MGQLGIRTETNLTTFHYEFDVEELSRLRVISVQDEWFHNGLGWRATLSTLSSSSTNFLTFPEAYFRVAEVRRAIEELLRWDGDLVVHGGLRGEQYQPHLFYPKEALDAVSKIQSLVRVDNFEQFTRWVNSAPERAPLALSFLLFRRDREAFVLIHSKSSASKFETDLFPYGSFISIELRDPLGQKCRIYPLICSDFLTSSGVRSVALDQLEREMAGNPNLTHLVSVINCTPIDISKNGNHSWKIQFLESIDRIARVPKHLISLTNYSEFPRGPRTAGLTCVLSNFFGKSEVGRIGPSVKAVLEVNCSLFDGSISSHKIHSLCG